MHKLKYIGIAALLTLGALFQFCKTPPEEVEITPAKFTFEEQLAAKYGEIIPISFKVLEKDVEKIDLFFNDSLVSTWQNPSGEISFNLDASYFGLGARQLTLQSTMKDKTVYTDMRLLRVMSDIDPEQWTASVVQAYPHSTASFTQGLEFSGGVLFESTGDPGHTGATMVAQVNLQTGATIAKKTLLGNYFGEGITVLNDKLYQITWQEQKCFVYNKKTLEMDLKTFSYTGEGWGLCNDGKSLIMSDGTERIVFRNPETFQIERTIEVYDDAGPRIRLNELEYIDGKIYANVWMLDLILVIDPLSGRVLAEIDASAVSIAGKGNGDVLNGIAHNPANNKTYLTGKFWPKLFEVRIEKRTSDIAASK